MFVCDGSKSVNFGQSCTSTSSCIKYATTTTTYTQTCTANVPNNEIDVHTVTPTQVCTITNPTETHTCNVTHSPNVGITSVSVCNPGQVIGYMSYFAPYENPNDIHVAELKRIGSAFAPPFVKMTCGSDGRSIDVQTILNPAYLSTGTYPAAVQFGSVNIQTGANGTGSGSVNAITESIFDDHQCGAGMCPWNGVAGVNVNCTAGNCTATTFANWSHANICGPAGFATVTVVSQNCTNEYGFTCTPQLVCADYNSGYPCQQGAYDGCICGDPSGCSCSNQAQQVPSPNYCADGSGAVTPDTTSGVLNPYTNNPWFSTPTVISQTVNSRTPASQTGSFQVNHTVSTLNPDTITNGCTAYEAAQ